MTQKPANAPTARQPERSEPLGYKILSGLLALLMHAGLAFFLFMGVQWATQSGDGDGPMVAELWTPGDLAGATRPPSEVIVGEDVSFPDDLFLAEPEEPIIEPDPIEFGEPEPVETPPIQNADIDVPEKPKEIEKPKEVEKPKETPKPDKAAEDRKKAQEAEAAEKTRLAQLAQREKELQERLNRERAGLGSSGDGTGAGSGSGGSGGGRANLDASAYIKKVEAIVRQNTPDFSHLDRITVVYRITLLQDGTIGNVSLVTSSGNSTYDQAVLRGIEKTNRVPPPEDWAILPGRYLNLRFNNK